MNKEFKFESLGITEAKIIATPIFEDARGYVNKGYEKAIFEENGISFESEEDLILHSKKGVLRGIHFQSVKGQDKLVRILRGRVFAVILDIKYESPTFGKWISIEMESDGRTLYVPKECALGTLALEDSLISCQCKNHYLAEHSDGILWNDKKLAIDWPIEENHLSLLVSEKDKQWMTFEEYKNREK